MPVIAGECELRGLCAELVAADPGSGASTLDVVADEAMRVLGEFLDGKAWVWDFSSTRDFGLAARSETCSSRRGDSAFSWVRDVLARRRTRDSRRGRDFFQSLNLRLSFPLLREYRLRYVAFSTIFDQLGLVH